MFHCVDIRSMLRPVLGHLSVGYMSGGGGCPVTVKTIIPKRFFSFCLCMVKVEVILTFMLMYSLSRVKNISRINNNSFIFTPTFQSISL